MASVLVVEDEPTLADLIVLNLRIEGHDVTVVTAGDEGLRQLRDGSFDAVVLDLMLPGVDGLALLAERRRLGLAPATRIVVVTAVTDDRHHLRAYELGCDAYVTKPFMPEELVAVVRGVLDASNADLARHRRAELRKASVLAQVDELIQRALGP